MSNSKYDPANPHVLTFTGRKFYFFDIKSENICIEDIAHSLSNLCRYGGHSKVFYSVAEHSIRCCDRGSNQILRMWGLLHDASEAYIGDICSPFKSCLGMNMSWVHMHINTYEALVAQAIASKFNLPWPIPEEVHNIDKELLYEEIETLWGDEPIITMTPKEAEQEFLSRFNDLKIRK